MLNNLFYKEQVKHFNDVMSHALSLVSEPLLLDELEIRLLSCHIIDQARNMTIPEHEHPNYELTFMELGEMTSYCDEYHVTCTPENNNILFIPPATLHHRIFENYKKNINITLVFTVSGYNVNGNFLCAELVRLIADKKYCMKLTPQLNSIFQEIKEQVNADIPLTNIVSKHLLYSFMVIFFQQNFSELFDVSSKARLLDKFDFDNNRIDAIKKYLVFLLNSTMGNTLMRMEEAFGMSSRHLNRIFKQETGMTIIQYQIKQKLVHAQNLLNGTKIPVLEIAHTLGFKDAVKFSCFFQRNQGCSPSYFRKTKKNK